MQAAAMREDVKTLVARLRAHKDAMLAGAEWSIDGDPAHAWAATNAEAADALESEHAARVTAEEGREELYLSLARAGRRAQALEAALREAIGIAKWMSGSPSFAPNGEAHEGWVKARAKLDELDALLDGPQEPEAPR